MNPKEAIILLTALIHHDSLRFLNYRERVSLDQAIVTLGKFIEESETEKLKAAKGKKKK